MVSGEAGEVLSVDHLSVKSFQSPSLSRSWSLEKLALDLDMVKTSLPASPAVVALLIGLGPRPLISASAYYGPEGVGGVSGLREGEGDKKRGGDRKSDVMGVSTQNGQNMEFSLDIAGALEVSFKSVIDGLPLNGITPTAFVTSLSEMSLGQGNLAIIDKGLAERFISELNTSLFQDASVESVATEKLSDLLSGQGGHGAGLPAEEIMDPLMTFLRSPGSLEMAWNPKENFPYSTIMTIDSSINPALDMIRAGQMSLFFDKYKERLFINLNLTIKASI
jgi:hypothetical protein